ncbi:Crp/Fnr family transcriptional regulator [Sporichthya brevicatena]|uniref:Crp/Fnr family transcriptional regulator n=1 Tax=Sporichthya brevicatena TaxID=171442 RepID=UPI0031D72292
MTTLTAPAPTEGFLDRIGPERAAALAAIGTRRGYPAGAILFLEGDVAHEAVVVLSGELKVVVGSTEGRDVVLDIYGPGELIGEWSVIDGKTRAATVTALTDVEVLTLPAAPFREFLDTHPAVREALLLDTIGRLRAQVRHQLEFGAGDAMGRVCARLAELADRYGHFDGSTTVIHSPLSQADLAAWTGLSREAVVKAMRQLRTMGWISNRGPDITVHDIERLRRRATH